MRRLESIRRSGNYRLAERSDAVDRRTRLCRVEAEGGGRFKLSQRRSEIKTALDRSVRRSAGHQGDCPGYCQTASGAKRSISPCVKLQRCKPTGTAVSLP